MPEPLTRSEIVTACADMLRGAPPPPPDPMRVLLVIRHLSALVDALGDEQLRWDSASDSRSEGASYLDTIGNYRAAVRAAVRAQLEVDDAE